jgi:hypothetical protein
MATNAGRFNTVSLTSDAALAQYRLVTLDPNIATTAGSAAYPNAQGQHALGITMTSADAAGKVVTVQYDGIALAEAGGGILAGDYITPFDGTTGKVGAATSNDAKVGVALSAATADGDIISVLLKPASDTHA